MVTEAEAKAEIEEEEAEEISKVNMINQLKNKLQLKNDRIHPYKIELINLKVGTVFSLITTFIKQIVTLFTNYLYNCN